MVEPRRLEFTGLIKPVELIFESTPFDVYTLLNWQEELQRHLPEGVTEYSAKLILEDLECSYYLPSLYASYSKLPNYDSDLSTEAKIIAHEQEFQHKYTPQSGHAVEITVYTRRSYINYENPSETWVMLGRRYLYNIGLQGYINLVRPIITRNNVLLMDKDYELGISITGQPTEPSLQVHTDHIVITGSYRGEIFYYPNLTYELQEDSGSKNIGTQPNSVFGYRQNRRALIVTNNSKTEKLYFKFGNSASGLGTSSNFLLPEASLTFETGKLYYEAEGNQPRFLSEEHLITMGLLAVRERGNDLVSYQEFYL